MFSVFINEEVNHSKIKQERAKSGKKPELLVTRMREKVRGDLKDGCQIEVDKSLTSEILTDPLGRLRCYGAKTTETTKNSSGARVTLITLV